MSIDEILMVLEESPRRIAAATAGVAETALCDLPILGEWSARDVLAHLRSCADARGDFIPKILAERRPTLRAIDPRTLIERTNYRELEFGPSFRAFRRQRARLLSLLRALPRDGWSRTAIVTGGGPARERTVLFYAQWLARHERTHVRHIERVAKATR
jgi:hypothetical protein